MATDFHTVPSTELDGGESPPSHGLSAEQQTEFVRSLTQSQRRVFLFILAQLPSPQEAEEILQNVNMVAWKKANSFTPGTNFVAWLCQIATFEVYRWRNQKRRSPVTFSDEFFRDVAERAATESEVLEARRLALGECLQKLRPADRELIQSRYNPGENGKKVAGELGRPANSVYQSLGRIRRALLSCIEKRIAAGGFI